jgi:NADPH-dependent 2,4-dienoyl-CoA reductase/sulfur reductase-like enzyme/nitrite reductase/ring-hydroxylating ferredoxin subunit
MAQTDTPPPGPDFTQGVPLASVPMGGVLAGHVDGTAVLLSRLDDGVHAVGGTCTHYGAALGEGLVVGDGIHCPWHHACFNLRTGAASCAPAFAPLARWTTEVVGDTVFVRGEDATPLPPPTRRPGAPERIVIIGGGAAGFAAAERLRTLGYEGALSMLSADDAAPCDRPNLSKDFLAGTAPEDWIPLQGPEFYSERGIELRLSCEVAAIQVQTHHLVTTTGERIHYDRLLIATGAEPRALPIPGFDLPNVFALRSLADARAIIAACNHARAVALVGAGFIGMEAAAALRARGLEVHVIAPDAVPLERVLGRELGEFVTSLHRHNGVVFHLQSTARAFDGTSLTLADGTAIDAQFVIVGAGVTPRTALAAAAGIAVDDGILVDPQLQTSVPGHYAAGDVARYRHDGGLVRVEHWVHAQRQGQFAAANLLGANEAFNDVPFFWTHHYGLDLRYTGHGQGWDEVRGDGSLTDRDFIARFFRNGTLVAAASVGRDLENLEMEAALRSRAPPTPRME